MLKCLACQRPTRPKGWARPVNSRDERAIGDGPSLCSRSSLTRAAWSSAFLQQLSEPTFGPELDKGGVVLVAHARMVDMAKVESWRVDMAMLQVMPDRGCEVSDSCLECPLSVCKYELPPKQWPQLLAELSSSERQKPSVI